eukprot:GHVR01059706.1.p1 GENE.GHVR01059706.1~~GHVR01059706.1.p1  ORF type:complete len:107 (+),score=29.62 GHVR01059706.1:50-322(+)
MITNLIDRSVVEWEDSEHERNTWDCATSITRVTAQLLLQPNLVRCLTVRPPVIGTSLLRYYEEVCVCVCVCTLDWNYYTHTHTDMSVSPG